MKGKYICIEINVAEPVISPVVGHTFVYFVKAWCRNIQNAKGQRFKCVLLVVASSRDEGKSTSPPTPHLQICLIFNLVVFSPQLMQIQVASLEGIYQTSAPCGDTKGCIQLFSHM